VDALHIAPGDALAAGVAPVVELPVEDLLPWRDVLHEGPVPTGLTPAELAEVRAAHLAARGWGREPDLLASMRERDELLDAARRGRADIVLWFEPDLVCALALAQVADRLAGHSAPVWLVSVPHRADRNLYTAWRRRRRFHPCPDAFAALRSPEPRPWAGVPAFSRLLAELPDARSGVSRLEREILAALRFAPRSASELFVTVSVKERPPWISDRPLWAVADDLAPLVSRWPTGDTQSHPPVSTCSPAAPRDRRPTAGWVACTSARAAQTGAGIRAENAQCSPADRGVGANRDL
jgi:hypothetical protein